MDGRVKTSRRPHMGCNQVATTLHTRRLGTQYDDSLTYAESILGKFVVIKDIWYSINNSLLVGRATDIFQNEIPLGTSNHSAFFSGRIVSM
jgi:hypothetical protein